MGLGLINKLVPTHCTSSSATPLLTFDNRSRVLLYDQLFAAGFSKHDSIYIFYNFQTSTKEEKIIFLDFKTLICYFFENELIRITFNMAFSMPNVNEHVDFLISVVSPGKLTIINNS